MIFLFVQAEWDDEDTKARCRVFYRSLAECAELLYKKVQGRLGDVFTMREVRSELPAEFAQALDDYALKKVRQSESVTVFCIFWALGTGTRHTVKQVPSRFASRCLAILVLATSSRIITREFCWRQVVC